MQENGFKELTLVLFESSFEGLHILFTTFLVRSSTGAQRSHERTPQKKRSNDLERSKFRQQVQSFVCVPLRRRVTFLFWAMLKNASEVTLVPKNFFPKNFELCAKFCEVQSLANGM
jgi:hypothetical protein